MGAERAGNKDGTIPAWSGGYVTPPCRFRQPSASQAGLPLVHVPFQHGVVAPPFSFTQPIPYGPAKW